MGDYHFVYKDLEGASTQWDDIQRKLGNLPEKPPAFEPPPFTPSSDDQPKDKTWIDSKTSEELEDLEDDLDDDRFLQEYRKKRLAEIQEAAKVLRFGSVIPISGSDFVREVSQAPSDVWVVVILYKDGIPECGLLMQSIEELARKYPATKFVKIISTDCIPNYPDRNVPTLLVYNNGAVKGNYVGLHSFGRRCTPEANFLPVIAVLLRYTVIVVVFRPKEVNNKKAKWQPLGAIEFNSVMIFFIALLVSVALVLCQSNPVLNDGHSRNEAVIEGVRKQFIEKIVADHEEEGDDYSSD
ncbi:hypothetical protein V8G54_010618 [Vigna mungo]|uniref:Phosducin domain-containing protein n=1 Tax=Vigna mungo TaxID=3915 RepID=A0AAQ3NW51_VIGMU